MSMVTKGRITWEEDGSPVVGYKVELWDDDLFGDDYVGSTYTNFDGRYLIVHPRKTDPWWYFFAAKGDFYIVVKNNNGEKVYQSRDYDDYSGSSLNINVQLNKIAAEYGVNTVYGKVEIVYPNGTKRPLIDADIVIKDNDLIFDDTLGKSITDTNGNYIITFNEDDYNHWYELGEDKPDIFASVFKKMGINNRRKKVWQTRVKSEATLPCKVDIKIPIIHVRGIIGSYKRCEGGILVTKPITDLKAEVYDIDNYFFVFKEYLGESFINAKDNSFELFVTGTSDFFFNPSGNDIFVRLVDKNNNTVVWKSKTFYDQDRAGVIKVNDGLPIDIVIDCPQGQPSVIPTYSKIKILNNCHDSHAVDIWLKSFQTEAGNIIEENEWAHRGSCPSGGEMTINLSVGHLYDLVAVDMNMINCGSNNPEIISCQRNRITQVPGNNESSEELVVIIS